MNPNDLEIRLLSNLLQVVSLRSIAKAARTAGISQPAMTRQMQYLEQTVGTTLLRRRNSGVEPTSAGEKFCAKASHFLSRFNDILSHVKAEARIHAREIIIGCDSDALVSILGRAKSIAVRRNPDIRAKLIEIPPNDSIQALVDRRIDLLATREKPAPWAYEKLHSELCQHRDTVLIVPADHPLCRQMEGLPLESLAAVPLVILDDTAQPGLLKNLKECFSSKSMNLNITQIASAEIVLLNYVLSGLGVGLVVGFRGSLQETGLVAIPVSGLFINQPRRTEFLWRGAEDHEGLHQMRQTIIHEFRNENKVPAAS